MRHELFEYEGRISQLVRFVEVDIPQAIGVLSKIIRHVEEYQNVRAADPKTSYDDVAMAKAIWAEEEKKPEEPNAPASNLENNDQPESSAEKPHAEAQRTQ
jgi:hypothetical protein